MTNLTATIDAYAALKREIAALDARKAELEASIAELPAGSYESDSYRLTISDIYGTKPDKVLAAELKEVAEAAVEKYRAGLSHQYKTAHTIDTHCRRHLVGLPTGKNLAA
jgi:hypothetical protein